MNPTTDELIKELNILKKYTACTIDGGFTFELWRFKEIKSQLRGRLDILEEFMDNTSYCCDDDKILQGLACRICLLRCDYTKEIFKIKEVLK